MRSRKTINQINVVPYIDVMLVLLVIFMVTAPLIAPGEITLPSVGQSKLPVPVAPLTVRVGRSGELSLRDMQAGGRETRLSVDELVERITSKQAATGQPQSVVIEADRNVQYEQVVRVLDALQRGGAQKVGLMVRPPTP